MLKPSNRNNVSWRFHYKERLRKEVTVNAREVAMEKLNHFIRDCADCDICTSKTVFGEGNPHSMLVLIGEAPGRKEDDTGRPFVGESGKLLMGVLKELGVKREDVYITNLVKCRPPANRTPTEHEIDRCSTYLHRELAIIEPKVVVTLGATASHALLNDTAPISKIRGRIYRIHTHPFLKTVIPTYHPAALLRMRNSEWLELFKTDLKLALARLKD